MQLDQPRLVMGLHGWMNGGEVSTGAVEGFVDRLGAGHATLTYIFGQRPERLIPY